MLPFLFSFANAHLPQQQPQPPPSFLILRWSFVVSIIRGLVVVGAIVTIVRYAPRLSHRCLRTGNAIRHTFGTRSSGGCLLLAKATYIDNTSIKREQAGRQAGTTSVRPAPHSPRVQNISKATYIDNTSIKREQAGRQAGTTSVRPAPHLSQLKHSNTNDGDAAGDRRTAST
ncbi:hypothetical protein PTSG_09177 [Salpingoeca rosetta]|uniref:Uncharacterized protein n=1 Tax=Salpingoeca rosetta (strain ATCC 50818 / BSB-021) TaxID=946362 RepID=F2UMY3_SALR5|nr:uncharacterized protein PTSG_09177 [Salpingoeca rosetta]EGD78482.1 hypothetical protein PTSG_09177 [Salpingoeca rosetta]|eukprot:XP_004989431.1 hypothetical protein PTSG_09177 [Salpingoeca rosetta]